MHAVAPKVLNTKLLPENFVIELVKLCFVAVHPFMFLVLRLILRSVCDLLMVHDHFTNLLFQLNNLILTEDSEALGKLGDHQGILILLYHIHELMNNLRWLQLLDLVNNKLFLPGKLTVLVKNLLVDTRKLTDL